jgi:hypothetical protein
MNPAHRTARFHCAIPESEIPTSAFAIVTACDPGDRPQPEGLNRRADDGLAAEIDRTGWRRFRVIGASPDLRHQEPGWGVVAGSLPDAVALGRRWGQRAIFWVEDDGLHLVDCIDGTSEDLGLWSSRTRFGLAMGPWTLPAVPRVGG